MNSQSVTTKEPLSSDINQAEIDLLIKERREVGATNCGVVTEGGQRLLVCKWPPLEAGAHETALEAGAHVFAKGGEGKERPRPKIDRFEPTSHQSSRNNTDIDHVVIHYTTSRNIGGTINHFKHGTPRVSAHYIVGRDGELVQMVEDTLKAWHAGDSGMNARSIGIEHVAALGDAITDSQAAVSAALVGWLMEEYEVPKSNVIPHVCIKPTSCCGDLFKAFGGGAGKSCEVQTAALHAWMESMGL